MQFNSHDTELDIISDITFWTKADLANDYVINDRTRNCNLGLEKVISLILRADQRWEWDDTNNTDLPIGRTNIVSGQRDYGITGATYLKITKVMCQDANGEWRTLIPIDKNSPEARNMNEQRNSGDPKYYDLIGNSIFLEPVPNYAKTLGLRIFFQRNVHYFVVGDTTAEPGFAQPYHRLISLYASADYLAVNEIWGRLKGVQSEIARLENGLLEFYSARNAEDQPRIRFRKENYGANELKSEGGNRNTPSNTVS